jgi:hypothetical protein
VRVALDVANTGTRPGSEVVQLYLSLPPAAGEPPRLLRGFAKVRLSPGERQTVTFALGPRDLAFFDAARGRWIAPAGRYRVWVGTSSRDLPLAADVTLARTLAASPPVPRLPAPRVPAAADLLDNARCPSDVVARLVTGGLTVVGVLPATP